MKKVLLGIAIGLMVIFAVLTIDTIGGFGLRIWFNSKNYVEQKIDEYTDYDTIKEVEDTCRSMQASYASDKIIYETYKESNPSWAANAKIRANKTATTYNEYILKNSFVWSHNVPDDICLKLEVIE